VLLVPPWFLLEKNLSHPAPGPCRYDRRLEIGPCHPSTEQEPSFAPFAFGARYRFQDKAGNQPAEKGEGNMKLKTNLRAGFRTVALAD